MKKIVYNVYLLAIFIGILIGSGVSIPLSLGVGLGTGGTTTNWTITVGIIAFLVTFLYFFFVTLGFASLAKLKNLELKIQKLKSYVRTTLVFGGAFFIVGSLLSGGFFWSAIGSDPDKGEGLLTIAFFFGFLAIIGILSLIIALAISIRCMYLEEQMKKPDDVSGGGTDDEL